MANIDDIYNTRLFELAGDIPRTGKLGQPDATATAHSKLCGSTVAVDLALREGRVADFAQTVRACLLGQASAAVLGREIVGSTPAELRDVGRAMRAMLKEGGEPPTGRWADLALLRPVKDYRARHASTLLVFDAVERALADFEVKHGPFPAPPTSNGDGHNGHAAADSRHNGSGEAHNAQSPSSAAVLLGLAGQGATRRERG
jgi:NifU-like protein involved in Fe-S cluster formation